MQLPDSLPILRAGYQPPHTGRVCAEQAVNWLVSGRLDLEEETDRPSCVQPVLNSLAIVVNDDLPDDERYRMWPLILRQPGTAHPEEEPVLSMRLAAAVCRWSADQMGWRSRKRRATLRAAADSLQSSRHVDDPALTTVLTAVGDGCGPYRLGAGWITRRAGIEGVVASRQKRSDALISLLSFAQDECERLTGHDPGQPDLKRLERLGELVGRSALRGQDPQSAQVYATLAETAALEEWRKAYVRYTALKEAALKGEPSRIDLPKGIDLPKVTTKRLTSARVSASTEVGADEPTSPEEGTP